MTTLRDGYHFIPEDPPPFAPFYDWLAEQIPDGGSFVEVGVWFGHSFLYMAERLHALGKSVTMHAVDTFRGDGTPNQQALVDRFGGSILGPFEENLARYAMDNEWSVVEQDDRFRVHEGDSVEVALAWSHGVADAVFIDCAHDPRSVISDLVAWQPWARMLGADDHDQSRVKAAVDAFVRVAGMDVFGTDSRAVLIE